RSKAQVEHMFAGGDDAASAVNELHGGGGNRQAEAGGRLHADVQAGRVLRVGEADEHRQLFKIAGDHQVHAVAEDLAAQQEGQGARVGCDLLVAGEGGAAPHDRDADSDE